MQDIDFMAQILRELDDPGTTEGFGPFSDWLEEHGRSNEARFARLLINCSLASVRTFFLFRKFTRANEHNIAHQALDKLLRLANTCISRNLKHDFCEPCGIATPYEWIRLHQPPSKQCLICTHCQRNLHNIAKLGIILPCLID